MKLKVVKQKKKGFVKVPKYYFSFLKLQEAVFLGYLIELVNNSTYKEIIDEIEWTRCSSNLLQTCLNLSIRSERTLMESMVNLEIVDRKMIGNPARRYIKLDFDRIQELSEC